MIKRFIFVVDNIAGPDIHFTDYEHPALAAGLASDPIVIEVPIDSPVQMGWTWDGIEFKEPGV